MSARSELKQEKKVDEILRNSLDGYSQASALARRLVKSNFPMENAVKIIKDKMQTRKLLISQAAIDELIEKETIVRCGECRYMLDNGRCSEFADDSIRPSVSDFCSYGQRTKEKQ